MSALGCSLTDAGIVYSVQAGLFAMLMNRLTEDVKAVFGATEQKIVAVGLSSFLCETPEFLASQAAVRGRICKIPAFSPFTYFGRSLSSFGPRRWPLCVFSPRGRRRPN
jgi:hypothetical protein